MKNAPEDPERMYDIGLERFVRQRVLPAIKNNQDWIHLNVGMTGTGKTSLGFFMYELYDEENCSIDFVALNRTDYAISMKMASEYDGLRFVMWDEADANKRDALNRFNKDAISMNWAIRGLRIFQQWNNPSAEWLDKPFIEEKINSVIYVIDKNKNRPRRYLFFSRKRLLRLLEERKDLKHETIRKYGPRYANYKGWFRQYKGKLWHDYEQKKNERMSDKVGEFYEKWGKKETPELNLTEACKVWGISRQTYYNKVKTGDVPQQKSWSKDDVALVAQQQGWGADV